MGQRSDFSKPCQGAAEKSANATRKALTARFRCGSQPIGMSTGRPAAKIENIGLALHLSCSDAADHNVDVNVSRMVVPIRVSADDGRMTGEVFRTKLQAKSLCLVHGQAVVGCIAWIEADDILMGLDITMLGVLAILAVCQQTGRCKREIATLKGIEDI